MEKVQAIRNDLLNAYIAQITYQLEVEVENGKNSPAAAFQRGCAKGIEEALGILRKNYPEYFNTETVNLMLAGGTK